MHSIATWRVDPVSRMPCVATSNPCNPLLDIDVLPAPPAPSHPPQPFRLNFQLQSFQRSISLSARNAYNSWVYAFPWLSMYGASSGLTYGHAFPFLEYYFSFLSWVYLRDTRDGWSRGALECFAWLMGCLVWWGLWSGEQEWDEWIWCSTLTYFCLRTWVTSEGCMILKVCSWRAWAGDWVTFTESLGRIGKSPSRPYLPSKPNFLCSTSSRKASIYISTSLNWRPESFQ